MSHREESEGRERGSQTSQQGTRRSRMSKKRERENCKRERDRAGQICLDRQLFREYNRAQVLHTWQELAG